MAVVLNTDELSLIYHTWGQAFDGVGIQVARNGGFLPTAWGIFRFPSENVLGNVRWLWCIPLDGVRIRLTGGLSDDDLDGTSCAWIGLQRLAMPLPNATAIAVALVPDTMHVLLPGVSNLIKCSGF